LPLPQETVVAASTALTNRQRMIEEMGGRLGTLTGELTDRGAFDLVVKTGSRTAHEVERVAMYESRFKETIDYVMIRALDKSVAARTDAVLGKRSTEESTLPKVCVILFCPDGEPKDEAQDEFAVRVTNNMTFRDLRVNAARQHGPTVTGSPALAAARRSSLPAGSGRPSCSPQRSACLRGCRPGPANGWLRFLCLQSPSRPSWPLQAACVSYPSPEPLTPPAHPHPAGALREPGARGLPARGPARRAVAARRRRDARGPALPRRAHGATSA